MYRLGTPTIGVLDHEGKQKTIMIPADAMLEVEKWNPANGMVAVVWNGLRVSMFAIDLEQRGQPVGQKMRDMSHPL